MEICNLLQMLVGMQALVLKCVYEGSRNANVEIGGDYLLDDALSSQERQISMSRYDTDSGEVLNAQCSVNEGLIWVS